MKITRRQLRKLITETMYGHELAGYLDDGQPLKRGDTLKMTLGEEYTTYTDTLTGEVFSHPNIMGDAVRLGFIDVIDDRSYPNPFMVLYNMGYRTLIEDEVVRHGIAGLAGIRDY